jgi:hypothetical protein
MNLFWLFLLTGPFFYPAAQGAGNVDPERVKAAVLKGVGFLGDHWQAPLEGPKRVRAFRSTELVLWALLVSGLPEDNVLAQTLFKTMMEAPLETTYQVALQAVILEELDRVKYQWRIRECGQFLLDDETSKGDWSYGIHFDLPKAAAGSKDLAPWAKKDAAGRRLKPSPKTRITLTRMHDGPGEGDHSNSAFAVLGIRACHDAQVVFPRAALELADKALRASARDAGKSSNGVTQRGWTYEFAQTNINRPYGSMTADVLVSLVILSWLLDENRDWKRDVMTQGGMEWIAGNCKSIQVTEDPARSRVYLPYSLWAVERLEALYGSEMIGSHSWYNDGAKALLDSQKDDGSWDPAGAASEIERVWNTASALLFLKREARPLREK